MNKMLWHIFAYLPMIVIALVVGYCKAYNLTINGGVLGFTVIAAAVFFFGCLIMRDRK